MSVMALPDLSTAAGIACSTLPPCEIDEGLERGGRVAAARIVEAQGRERGRPIFQHAHEAACLDVVADVGFHRQSEADRCERCGACETRFVEGDRALDVDVDRLSILLER